MRAWSYFTLVQFFGDVPLRDNVVTSDADVAIDRMPQADIYQFIFDDILDAEQKLPEEAQDMGRVNKWVVKAIMARIYLTSAGFPMNQKENYAKAKEKALEVINSGQYSLRISPLSKLAIKASVGRYKAVWLPIGEDSLCIPL